MQRALLLGPIFFVFASCASAPKPPPPQSAPSFVDGVRQKPVTSDEVEREVGRRRGKLAACYRTERLNSKTPAAFLLELTIPNDGSAVPVTVLTSEPPGQHILQACILGALNDLRFPPHVGEVLRLRVPIEPLDTF